MTGKVYFYGFGSGEARRIKVGHTATALEKRRKGIVNGQMTRLELHLLAAVNGTATHEREVLRYFSPWRATDVNSQETFRATPELEEYIHWARHQPWCQYEETVEVDETPDFREWRPTEDRRISFAPDDPSLLFQLHRDYCGPLAGTPFDYFTPPSQSGDDYYTPLDLIAAARQAMGDIDLDAASHHFANRILRIKDFFHIHRSAFEHRWFGRVWLNPPYGDNGPWFEQISRFWNTGDIEQLCMISPVWAFTTCQAKPMMNRCRAMVLLNPTPRFWGHPKQRTGTNHPHAIVYFGNRVSEFRAAFKDYGIPFMLD